MQFLMPYLENKHSPSTPDSDLYTATMLDKNYSRKMMEEKVKKRYDIQKIVKELIKN